jgi:hypothetical protein
VERTKIEVTPTVVHQQISGKVFNEELGVMLQSLSIQGVEHSVPSSVGGTGAAVCLAA